MESGPVRNMNFGKFIPRAASVVITGLFLFLTVSHLQAFRDRFTFWQNAVETSPSNAYNYNTLGAMYFMDGKLDKAEQFIRKSLVINPSELQANGNAGLICMRKGDLAEAERFYRKEISINPSYDNVYYNYGILYFKKGSIDSAAMAWEKTIEINPLYVDAYKALLFVYDTLKRQDDYSRITGLARKNGLTRREP